MIQVLELLKNPAVSAVAGGVLSLVVREGVALAVRLRAARLKADGDPKNDAEAVVLERFADKIEGGKQ